MISLTWSFSAMAADNADGYYAFWDGRALNAFPSLVGSGAPCGPERAARVREAADHPGAAAVDHAGRPSVTEQVSWHPKPEHQDTVQQQCHVSTNPMQCFQAVSDVVLACIFAYQANGIHGWLEGPC